ncbi:MAG: hypothetical protein IT437_02945 [Phycisphaerales bacterium]|nr:hypothetical protein [Phycisphaerales bacterium]
MPRNWFEILVITLALASGAIGALAKKLREQAAKKRAQDAATRAELERLRTGRPAPEAAPPPPPAAPEPDLVRRRREQIERLRRGSRPGSTGESVVIQVPGVGPVVIARPAPQPTPRPADQRPKPPARREGKRKPRPSQAPAAPRLEPAGQASTARLVAAPESTEAVPTAARGTPLVPTTRDEWRRLIVMREVLGPPLALRGP